MNLANSEMAMAIAEMAQRKMQLYLSDDGDIRLLHDYHVATPLLDSSEIQAEIPEVAQISITSLSSDW